MRTFYFIAILLVSGFSLQAQSFDAKRIREHITYLASDALEGRAPGTNGEKLAGEYIAKFFAKYKLEPRGTNGYYQHFTYKVSDNPHDTAHLTGKEHNGNNIVGFLDNGANKTIVIGGHYDHLGIGGEGSSLEGDHEGKIHNGADDNASGTAGVMELARYFTSNKVKEKTNFLFIAFSAEESGLIGSKHFCSNPTYPLEKIHSMINMDMIGRLVDSTQKLMIFGVGTGDVFVPRIHEINQSRFQLVLDSSGIGPSDQTSFYLKKIPVLHFFTGQHTDYHKSSDDVDKINFQGEVKVLGYMADLIMDLSEIETIKYLETSNKESGRVAFKVTLGVMPDYAYQDGGLRIDAVSKDKPAEKGGLMSGDIVIQLGDVVVDNIQDYMKALAKYKKGDTVTVKVKRGEQSLEKTVTF